MKTNVLSETWLRRQGGWLVLTMEKWKRDRIRVKNERGRRVLKGRGGGQGRVNPGVELS